MGFGAVFWKTWKDYKRNFLAILLIGILFITFPSFIESYVTNLAANLSFSTFILLIVPAFIFYFLLSTLGNISLVAASLKWDRFNLKKALRLGSTFYFSALRFYIIFFIFIIGLFILLIVPGIVFTIYWIFSPYVLVDQRSGVIGSLGKSYRLAKGHWWSLLGYSLLLILICLIPFAALGIIGMFIEPLLSASMYVIVSNAVSSLFSGALFLPFCLLFYKNLYKIYKKRRKN